MARTFKQYGCAHDVSGSLNVVVQVGGVEVYNGAVTADTEPHSETPLPEHELFSFELADDVSGDTAWEVSVTGTDDASQLCLGPLKANNFRPNMTIPLEYFVEKLDANGMDLEIKFTNEQQLYIDTTLGDRIDADVRARLQAGTSVPLEDAPHLMRVNEEAGVDSDVFGDVTKTLSNGHLNGEAYDVTVENMWPVLHNSQTLAMTANLELPVFEYNPPLE